MTTKAIITIPGTVDTDSIVKILNESLADFLTKGVEIEFTTPRLSKSDKVILQMAEIVASGEYVDRNGIASAVDCTVSLISATIKDNVDLKEEANAKEISDHTTVKAFLEMEKNAKAMKKAQTQLQNLMKMQAELQKAGVVLQFPVITANEETKEEAKEETKEETKEEATVTPIAKPSRSTRKPANA